MPPLPEPMTMLQLVAQPLLRRRSPLRSTLGVLACQAPLAREPWQRQLEAEAGAVPLGKM